jgi:hypothetical protein
VKQNGTFQLSVSHSKVSTFFLQEIMFSPLILSIGLLSAACTALPYQSYPIRLAVAPAYPPTWVGPSASPANLRTTAGPAYISEEPEDIINSVKTLSQGIDGLNKAYASFSGRAEEALDVETASDKLYKQMETLIGQINAHKEFTILEAANLGTAFLDFIPNSVTAIDSMAGKKALFDQMGATPVVVQELKRQRDQSKRLDEAIAAKVPEIAKDEAKDMYGEVSDSFDKVIATFSEGNGADWNAGTEASAEDLVPS